MAKINIIFILTIFLFHVSCSYKGIKGKFEVLEQEYHPVVYLINFNDFNSLATSYVGQILDSASINKKGEFAFHQPSQSNEDGIYFLAIQKKNQKFHNYLENENIAACNYIPIIIKNEKGVNISISSGKNLADAWVQAEENGLQNLRKERQKLYQKYLSNLPEINEENLAEVEKSKLNFQQELVAKGNESKNFFVYALALRWASIEGNYERIPELVKAGCELGKSTNTTHPWANQLCEKAKNLPLCIGDVFPDYELPMLDGGKKSIQSLLGTKLTLVDMWASWCAPCRKENRTTLVPLWNNYHDRGFQIIGYALDSSLKGLQNAITKDGVNLWPQASHLNGDESPLFEKLKITVIPANYLLNDKGIVVAKNLHQKDLENFVKEFIEK